MATTTKLLQLLPKPKPTFPKFSSSSSNPNLENSQTTPNNTTSSEQPNQTTPNTTKPFSFSSIANNNSQNPSSKTSSFDEIRKRNLNNNNIRSEVDRRPGPTTGKVDFNRIRENVRNFNNNNNNVNLPSSIFGRDREGGGDEEGMRSEFVSVYSHGELGEKLKMLRPVINKDEKKGWFSLQELKDRLVKIRENEEKESKSMIGDVYKELKESLIKLSQYDDKRLRRQ